MDIKKLVSKNCLIVMLVLAIVGTSFNVEAASDKVKLNKTSVTLTQGKTYKLKLNNAKSLNKSQKKKVKWSSTNKAIVKVSKIASNKKSATIKAVKKGSSTIKLKYNGKTYKCKVTVNAKKSSSNTSSNTNSSSGEGEVWIPESGSKYHCKSTCSGMKNPTKVTVEEAESMGYTPCKRCY